MKYTFNTIFFEATRRCNLRCDLCMASSNNPQRVRESVRHALRLGQHVREDRQDARRQGDVPKFHIDSRGGREGPQDRQERARGEGRRLVGVGVDDRG